MTWPDCWNDSERSVGASTLPVDVTLDNTTLRLAVASVCVVDAELVVECTVKYVPTATAITTTHEKPVQEQPFTHDTSSIL